ncbi:MAG: VWA domain-containing protein [Clostridiales Family XIII bacterium]|jgi:stress response protein SCP2|nr:VWA domain-containing protein [Clostridiales Family XIII bacterium]
MQAVQKGFRDKLDNHLNTRKFFPVKLTVAGNAEYDFCCFGVDSVNKLSDDRYMVFFNQTRSPNGEITFSQSVGTAEFSVNLPSLPNSINKLVFTVNIDGGSTMGEIRSLDVIIGNTLALQLTGKDFQREKAVIVLEVYKKDIWRVSFLASGFNGGLPDLLRHYGGEESESQTVPVQPAPAPPVPAKISIEKKLEKEAPKLVSLAKPLKVSLEKHKLVDVVAKVGLVMDISASMSSSYSSGSVQQIVDKVVPLAVQFDDDGELDFWYFGNKCKQMKPVTTKNYQQTTNDWKKRMRECGGGTNLAEAVDAVVDEYKHSKLPAYVLVVTDGATSEESRTRKLLTAASKQPIFWQFVGIGGAGYGFLEDLDTMSGRYVDNANFFALDDFNRVSPDTLYDRLLGEFPSWLKEAKRLGLIK